MSASLSPLRSTTLTDRGATPTAIGGRGLKGGGAAAGKSVFWKISPSPPLASVVATMSASPVWSKAPVATEVVAVLVNRAASAVKETLPTPLLLLVSTARPLLPETTRSGLL